MFNLFKKKPLEHSSIISNNPEAAIPLCNRAHEFDSSGNYTKAFKYYLKAAKYGDGQAQCLLGTYFLSGQGTKINLENAEFWFHESIKNPNTDALNKYNACCNLGQIYYHKKNDPHTAFTWFKRAAENGNLEAQAFLGEMYDNGAGITKDIQQAVYWYELSANAGHPRSQFNLAEMYLHGDGVEINHMKATQLMMESAKQGNEPAVKRLQEMMAHLKANGLI
ncbi:tetratricopeptide repeat protein [Aliivibrio salmonicida]|uniref:tetratricopeptide repeat protein n=1 Tax=Aliivibrio salmonicida TaxID=40269 RepID=UPI003D0FA807